jgi:hypothetical protein
LAATQSILKQSLTYRSILSAMFHAGRVIGMWSATGHLDFTKVPVFLRLPRRGKSTKLSMPFFLSMMWPLAPGA